MTLDATGTLIKPREAIGTTYVQHFQRITRQTLSSERRECAETLINRRFPIVFNELSTKKPNFGKRKMKTSNHFSADDLSESTAFPWWHELILDVLPLALVREMPEDVAQQFTSDLYAHFASGDAWRVFDDVLPVLAHLRQENVTLGVISNFDERLETILRELALREYFDVVTTSWQHGQMKPHASIFTATFAQLKQQETTSTSGESTQHEDVLHVGDHRERDYWGAREVGVHARWLQRHPKEQVDVPSECIISSLSELLG